MRRFSLETSCELRVSSSEKVAVEHGGVTCLEIGFDAEECAEGFVL